MKNRHPRQPQPQGIFHALRFSFPLVDIELTPATIELLSLSIQAEGGRVVGFEGKSVTEGVDYLLIHRLLQPEAVNKKVEGKLRYKEMLDYRFVTECLEKGRLLSQEPYSLYFNMDQFEEPAPNPRKKVKTDPKPQYQLPKEEKREKQQSKPQSVGEQLVKQEKKQKTELSPPRKSKLQEKKEKDEEEHSDDGTERLSSHQKEVLKAESVSKVPAFSMKAFVAGELTKMSKIYATERDLGRKLAYMKAASAIRALPKELESEKEVENMAGIGKKIADKIKELMETGGLQKLQQLQQSERNTVCGEFCTVWGIGPSKAQELWTAGLRSVEQLHTRLDLLSKNQQLGLRYHSDFKQPIPREKVKRMFQKVQSVMANIVPSLDLYRMEVCGSYRRGKPTCGDMDIIISRKDGTYEPTFLGQLVEELHREGFLTDHLTHPKTPEGRSSISYMGVCRFEAATHHRIDIKYYPLEQYAWALLYFTGSGEFNRELRLYAMKNGLQLSDHGAVRKPFKGVTWHGDLRPCLTEHDIFALLGMPYKSPAERSL